MIAFDLAYELTLGAWLAGGSTVASHRRALLVGLAASLAVYIPICAIGLWQWPGWQSMYLADLEPPGRLIRGVIVQTAALVVAFLVGFFATTVAGADRRRLLGVLLPSWLLLLSMLFGLLWRRAFVVTSTADFLARSEFAIRWGTPDALLGGPVMWFLIASGAANLGAYLVAERCR
jgi:hypothetical protein